MPVAGIGWSEERTATGARKRRRRSRGRPNPGGGCACCQDRRRVLERWVLEDGRRGPYVWVVCRWCDEE